MHSVIEGRVDYPLAELRLLISYLPGSPIQAEKATVFIRCPCGLIKGGKGRMRKPFPQLLVFSMMLLLWSGISWVVLVDRTKGEDDERRPLEIKEAKWEIGDKKLVVKGKGPRSTEVVVNDVTTGIILGATKIQEEEWELKLKKPSPIPCEVSATSSNGETVERRVKNAPSNCGIFSNIPPNGMATPTDDVTIKEGESIHFTGTGTDPDGHEPLMYMWDFGGGALNSELQSPGEIVFLTPGVYFVTLNVSDSQGLADPTPDTLIVTVEKEGGVGPGAVPL